MHNRLRLLRLITSLLYFGPLLAGLMGQGWAMVPVFVGIFLLWSVILRPHLWPGSLADLARSQAVVPLASLVATQILLVVICFALGRGIGGVLAVKPALPAYLPAALSFLSVPLSRLVWNPRVAAQNVGFDPVLDTVPPGDDAGEDGAIQALARVMALGDDVPEDILQQHLTAISDHLDPVLIRQILGDEIAGGTATVAGIKALIVHATDPAVNDLLAGSAYPAQGFAAAGRVPDLISLFARRCVRVLEDDPDLLDDCPPLATIRQMAQKMADGQARAELTRLAGLIDHIASQPAD